MIKQPDAVATGWESLPNKEELAQHAAERAKKEDLEMGFDQEEAMAVSKDDVHEFDTHLDTLSSSLVKEINSIRDYVSTNNGDDDLFGSVGDENLSDSD